MADSLFHITLQNFNEGNGPIAHIDEQSFIGNGGHASDTKCDLLSKPGFITQSPGLSTLTNGNESGVVNELIRVILDIPTDIDTTFGAGATKLFKISSASVISNATYPQVIPAMVDGQSVISLKGNLFILYNTASAGDIARMPLNTDVIDATWGSITVTGGVALDNAPHPSAVKEDILIFGNGRYAGVYIQGEATLDAHKLDFGEGSQVVDVVFNANVWWIAVNRGTGGRVQGEVYLYDGSALSSVLADEAGVGLQKIGFLYILNGTVYVCYEELSSNSFTLGIIAGRQVKPLAYFSGTLPDHRQKTLYKNTILFISNNEVWSFGAVVQSLPLQISKLSDGGHTTLGAIASPFGVPMIASTQNTSYRLAQFSGYTTDSHHKSIYIDVTNQRDLGKITEIIVTTKSLVGLAQAVVTIEGNQSKITSNALNIVGAGKTRHVFRSIALDRLEDIRVIVDYATGDITNDCPIRKIEIGGMHIKE